MILWYFKATELLEQFINNTRIDFENSQYIFNIKLFLIYFIITFYEISLSDYIRIYL